MPTSKRTSATTSRKRKPARRLFRGGTQSMRIPEIRREHGMSDDYWHKVIARGDLPAIRLPGAGTRAAGVIVLRADLRKFLERHRHYGEA